MSAFLAVTTVGLGGSLSGVLSMWKLRVGVEHYYLSQVARGLDDYYTGRGEAAGRWLGTASSGLGLERGDEVTMEALQAVLAGLRPGTGLTPGGTQLRTWRNRVPGFDLTFSAPKSVSAMYALVDPIVASQIVEACDAAVDAAVAWLEREACFVRRGSNNRAAKTGLASAEWGIRRLPGAGFVAAGFRHRTSRAGDPQLHTHVLVANLSRGPDQRWTALDGQALYRSKHTAGAVYQTVLRDELTRRLGVGWGPIHHGAGEIAGIPRRLLRLWSKRRVEIEAELAATGQFGPAAADAAALATRPRKEHTDIVTLRERWLAEAGSVGFGADDIDQLLTHSTGVPTDEYTIIASTGIGDSGGVGSFVAAVAEAMTRVDSTCTRHQISEAVAATLPRGIGVAGLERLTNWVLAHPELIPITPHPAHDSARAIGWEQRWTTRTLLRLEHDLIDAFSDPTPTARLDPDLVEHHLATATTLGADQAETVRKMASQGRRVEVIVGRAGTGKTYTLNTIRRLFEDAGYIVVGAAPSARAARELADGAGIDASTFPRFHHRHQQLSASHVLVIDEAGMAGTIDLHSLFTAARHAGAKVILVGDHHQLPEVTAGGGFATAVQHASNEAAELTVNRRQTHEWEHTALAELRHGNVLAGFSAYLDHDRVILHEHPDQMHTAAVNAWLDSHRAGRHAVLLAGTRAEARTLNQLARRALADHVHGPALELDERCFQAGDRVVLLRNSNTPTDLHTGHGCWVDNGMIATITGIHEDDRVDIRLGNGRHIRLDADYIRNGHIDHGYATTIHKAQGLTCDEMILVGPTGLYREAVYVAMSRARHGSWIHATSRQAAELADQPHTTQAIPLPAEHPDELDHDLTAALHDSRAKTFAATLTPHLTDIDNLARTTTLDRLWVRHLHVRNTTRRLVAAGLTDPATQAERHARARTTRSLLSVGGRVNAHDWDNVGTVTAIFDRTGTALVTFTTSDGQRTATKTLHWSELSPIDHPEAGDISDTANDYFGLADRELADITAVWNSALTDAGIAPHEPAIVAAAIDVRRQLVTHQLAATPPHWLTWWLGQRPTDPAGADIWDTELAHLAAWRDAHHVPNSTPGYGPAPHHEHHRDRWREHLDRNLSTRTWLHHHTPDLPTPTPPTIDIAAVRERLHELDALIATAPPDQTRIIHDLTTGRLSPADIHTALTAAATTQGTRRDWILEHWPHLVEHAELTRIHHAHDPLAHWPTPPDPAVQQLLDELQTSSVDTPEPRTLQELDAAIAAANPHHQLAQIADQQNLIRQQISDLKQQGASAPAAAAVIDQHLERLHERLRDLEDAWRDHDTAVQLWNIGSRPRDLQDAIVRRANHLAHTAIAAEETWVVRLIASHADRREASNVHQLHRLVADIAAWRERDAITGTDPFGPEPERRTSVAAWTEFTDQLASAGPTPHVDVDVDLDP